MNIFKLSKYYWLLIAALFTFNFVACKSSKDMEENSLQVEKSSIPVKLDNALLWKISGNGLKVPSYLYGTIHIINSEDYFLPEGTLGAMEKSHTMVFEINMNDMTDISAQMGLLKEIFMKDNLTLKDLVTEEDYGLIETHFKKMGLPMMMFERMKPMFLTVFAGEGMDVMGLQNGSMKSYEMEFFELAQKANKEVDGLETMEYQMSMFDSIPYQVQADMLVQTIKSSDAGSDQFKQMIDIYKAQNIEGMVSMISEEDSGMGGYESLLVDQRNMNWIPIMKEQMVNGPIFYAVGAGHLGGKNGVINLLKKEGFSVTPIKASGDIN